MKKQIRMGAILLSAVIAVGVIWKLNAQAIMTWLDKPEPFREWHIPENPRDKANYDFAHGIKLPDSMPKPVPFEFIKKDGRKATPQEYFEHLCKTEAGDFIFRTVDGKRYQILRFPLIFSRFDEITTPLLTRWRSV